MKNTAKKYFNGDLNKLTICLYDIAFLIGDNYLKLFYPLQLQRKDIKKFNSLDEILIHYFGSGFKRPTDWSCDSYEKLTSMLYDLAKECSIENINEIVDALDEISSEDCIYDNNGNLIHTEDMSDEEYNNLQKYSNLSSRNDVYIALKDITDYDNTEYLFKKGKIYFGEISDETLFITGEDNEEYDYSLDEINERFIKVTF